MNIVNLGVSGATIYAAAGATVADNASYKSTNGGATWAKMYVPTMATAKAIVLLAVAPDDANVVVAVSNANVVYYSTNGGSTWTDLGIPVANATLQSLEVSPSVAGTRTLAVGGKTAAGAAELWTLSLAVAASWTARVDTTKGFSVGQTHMLAVKFSPSFA